MKKKFLVLILSMFTLINTLTPIRAEDEEKPKAAWKYDPNGWWYDNGDGTWPYSTFMEIDGVNYYFKANGYMATGWQAVDGKWYYFEGSGAMKKGWIYDGAWYYLDEQGVMVTGFQTIDKVQYYMNSSGAMVTGWQPIGGKWYYFEGSGAMKTGWIFTGGKWYYLDDKGVMLTGFTKIGGVTYYLDSSGAMAAGWKKISGVWYYFDSSGAMKTGWTKVGGTWYYMDKDGKMQTGWIRLDGTYYYLDGSGAMKTGWIQDNWYWYYLNSAGEMLTGWQTINGTKYHLNETSGHWDEPEGDPKFYRPDSILILANKKHKLPDGYVPDNLVIPDVQRTGANVYMKAEAASAMKQMFAGAKAAGITLVMGSGYRSEATQRAIYNGYVARDGQAAADRYSARPGYSEHQTGLAVDISDASGAHYLYESFESTAEGKWLFANAYKYGFILRYPKGKESITGYMYEPWHYRYVGTAEAAKIYASGKTFEEYYGVAGGGY